MDTRKGQGKEQMSKKDTVIKTFMRENTVFADAFNYLIFNGDFSILCIHMSFHKLYLQTRIHITRLYIMKPSKSSVSKNDLK